MIQVSFLKNWDEIQNLVQRASIDEREYPLIYVIKIYKYRRSLRKSNCKLRIFITNKNVR